MEVKFYSVRRGSAFSRALLLIAAFLVGGVQWGYSQMAGSYTIDKNSAASSTNFQSFTSAVQSLRGLTRSDGGPSLGTGVSGAVTFNVTAASGPYNEQISIPAITGASSTNTITFNGNGQRITFNTTSSEPAVIKLDGADYIRLVNINVVPSNATYTWGIWLLNQADYNIVESCNIDITASTTTSSGYSCGIAMVGSALSMSSYTTGGIKGRNNLFKNNEIYGSSTNNGMYCGIMINGGSSHNVDNNVFEGNYIHNFYVYGIYHYFYSANPIFRGNRIIRGTKPSYTTFYGIYSYYCAAANFYDNYIADNNPLTSTLTYSAYGIYDYYGTTTGAGQNHYINNTIKFNNGYYLFGIYALQYYTTSKKFLHNTIYFNTPNGTFSYGYGIYNSEYNYATIDIKNNIVDLNCQNVMSTTYNIYSYSYTTVNVDGNVLPRSNNAYHYTGYLYGGMGGGQSLDWASWRANPNNPDPNGSDIRPAYVNVAGDNFTPMTIDLDGAGVAAGVNKDSKGNNRSLTNPDPGAIEFDLPINVSAINYPGTICQGQPVDVEVTITNNAAFALSGFRVQYSINSTLVATENYVGSIASGASVTFIFAAKVPNTTTGNFTLTANVKGKAPVVSKAYTVNPSPVGSLFTKGTPFNGSFNSGDGQDPDIVAYGDNIRYAITPPTGYNNAGFGSTWTFDFWEMKTVNGTDAGATHTKTNPGSGNAVSSFTPLLGQSDSMYRIRYAVRSLSNGCIAPVVSRQIFVAPRPVVSFTTLSACEGDEVQFTNNSTISSGSVSYIWRFGDGDSTWLINPAHKYAQHGTYNVQLVAVSNYGYSSLSNGTATVKQNPRVEFGFTNKCEGTAIPFVDGTIVPSGTPTYTWSWGDGTPNGTGVNPSHLYAADGTYEVKLTVTADGCTDEKISYVTQAPLPTANFTTSGGGCNNASVTFTNNSSVKSGTIGYVWDFADGTTSTEANPAHRYTGYGIFNVKLTAKTAFGCQDDFIVPVSLIEAPAANFNNGAICSKENVNFINASVEPSGVSTSYSWDFSDGTNFTSRDVNKSFLSIGSYQVKLTAISSNGCTDVLTRMVNVDEQPSAEFYAEDVCEGNKVEFRNASTGNNGNLSFNWDMGGQSTSSAVNPSVNLPVGAHTIVLEVNTPSGCKSTINKVVNVNATPTVSLTSTSGQKGDGTIAFTANATPNANYVIFFGDGGRESGNTGNGGAIATTYTYVNDGLYNVSIRVSKNGCSVTAGNEASVFKTSAIEVNNGELLVYPNPSNGKFFLALDKVNFTQATIEVVNAAGQRILTSTHAATAGNTASIDLSHQAAGVYLVSVITESGVFNARITLNK